METITCIGCGRVQPESNRYCEMCGKETVAAANQPTAPSVVSASPEVTPAAPVNAPFRGVSVAAQDVLNKARSLSAISKLIFILVVIGGSLMLLFSIVPTCPANMSDCYSDEKGLYNFIVLFPTGLASILSVAWFNGIAETIAARAALAAEVEKAKSE